MRVFYHKPGSIMDIIHQGLRKPLARFDTKNILIRRWGGSQDDKKDIGSSPALAPIDLELSVARHKTMQLCALVWRRLQATNFDTLPVNMD
jgi:hypothetical protein